MGTITLCYTSCLPLLNISMQHYSPNMLSRKHREPRPRPSPYPLEKTPGPNSSDARKTDIFYQLSIDPLREVNNARLLCSYTTGLGKIKSRHSTGLTHYNQRRLGKAIRRARAMGIVPFMSRNRQWDRK